MTSEQRIKMRSSEGKSDEKYLCGCAKGRRKGELKAKNY
jgi:hypothetical protein